ncbi:hypothetical protein QRD43_07675 [Pelomonas sp. APW6]|uniref:Uncharacterized protein n=1 Tax=Roseateles subflavus TaxID=3053353 RepID=A0ABT7LJE1_9BURK|nr:hypothetical protein [Pelomonas sp. APW6]MDL5031785.1 hypothetical protein [Pelomonas sp. APW6]
MHFAAAVIRLLVLLGLACSAGSLAWAQAGAPAKATSDVIAPDTSGTVPLNRASVIRGVDPQPASASENAIESQMTSREFRLSVLIVMFGIIISLIQFLLLRSIVKEKTEIITRTFTITLIVVGTMFLIAAGYRTEQISPALGLFGTIAGYLLGRTDQSAARSSAHPGE